MINRYFILFIFLISPLSVQAERHVSNSVVPYNLAISFDIANAKISGVVNIDVQADQVLEFHTGHLTIREVKLNQQAINFKLKNSVLKILPKHDGDLEIRYDGVFADKRQTHSPPRGATPNIIGARDISLTKIWYPWLDRLKVYHLTAVLPEGFNAISEANNMEKVTQNGQTKFIFDFPHVVDAISFVASDRWQVSKDYFNEIEIVAYFFPEVAHLAEEYISYTKKYLALYEDRIGKFPFERFSIVVNFLPTGYSMPTFTLLGERVVKLPLIVKTSLGHEILHQWFGNLVYIDHEQGNWAEGLTTYLADHLYKELEGKGWQYRKQILVNYESHVTDNNEIPVRQFRSRVDFATKVVGYGKTAMVFHILKNLVGEDVFYKSLQELVHEQSFQRASWDDVMTVFERNTGENLDWFVSQWIDKKGLPQLHVENMSVRQYGSEYKVNFDIVQQAEIYRIDVPVTIHYVDGGKTKQSFNINKERNSFTTFLDKEPDIIIVDEDYDIARKLSDEELPPVIARLIGAEKVIIALPVSNKDAYTNIINSFEEKGGVKKESLDIKHSDIKNTALVILGDDNPLIERLYGKLDIADAGFNLSIKKNPWNPRKVVGVFSAKSKQESEAAFRKIFHYGKYSELSFDMGQNTFKHIEKSSRGIKGWQREQAVAINVAKIQTLSDVIGSVANRKIVYVGERHDQFSHSVVQLDVIKGLHRKGGQVAIGMEMFQRPFQDVLDRYISGKIDERAFLEKSEYFESWGFDYNLYKPIIDFAKSKQIPIVALNISREILKKVSAGGIDSLSEEEKKLIPTAMDFSDDDYKKRLKEVFNMHADMRKDSSDKKFEYFYQAQLLWDEIMAMSIYEFLKVNTGHQMIVLVGNGHLTYGAGIPQRTYRRNAYDYAIILNDATVQNDIADYLIFPKPVAGITAPKLMVFLREEDGKVSIDSFLKNSVSEKAGLEAEDIIVSLDGVVVSDIDDIKLHLFFKKEGDVLKVKILRKRFLRGDEEKVFDVIL